MLKLFIFLVFALTVFARESYISSFLAKLVEERLAEETPVGVYNPPGNSLSFYPSYSNEVNERLHEWIKNNPITEERLAEETPVSYNNNNSPPGYFNFYGHEVNERLKEWLKNNPIIEESLAEETPVSFMGMGAGGRRKLARENRLSDFLEKLIEERLAEETPVSFAGGRGGRGGGLRGGHPRRN